MPAINLRRIQLGQQTAFTTAVPATSLLRGVDDAMFTQPNEAEPVPELGFVGAGDIVPGMSRYGEGSLTLAMTYQDIRYGLQGVFGAPVTTGSSPTWTHTWAAPAATVLPTPTIYTVEYGTDGAEYRAVGAVVVEHILRGGAQEDMQQEINFVAHRLQPNTMATGLPLRNVDAISFVDAALWIDPIGTPHGTTQFNNAFIAFEWAINTNRHVKQFEGPYPTAWGDGRWDSSLTLTLEFTAQSKAILDALMSDNVIRNIRIRFQQSASRVLRIDFTGTLNNAVELFGDRDGNMIVELEFVRTHNTTVGSWCSVQLINNVNALP